VARGTRVLAGVLAAGALATACSSGASSSTSTTARRPAVTTTTRPTAATTTTSAGGATTTTAASGTVACATSQLAASLAGGNGAAGTIETTVALRNNSSRTCVLAGYPALQMVDAQGSAVPTKTVNGGSYAFTKWAQTVVSIAPGQSGSFNIGYSDVPMGSETSCPSSAALRITPPANYDPLTVPASLAPCNGGTLVVSPILSGATGGT
jgi:hypothetical protein